MRLGAALGCVLAVGVAGAAQAADCPSRPDALGVSRTIVVDPREHARIGSMQYAETLPLADKEVVLTFDDGPLPPYSTRILDILASQCVKATYFVVGRMARAQPELVRRIAREGHTLGTHTENHPYRGLRDLPAAVGQLEIDQGIASTAAALGGPDSLAPFFRYSGFGNTEESETDLARRGIMVWGADFPADDWMRISDKEIVRRAMRRLEAKGRGVLLLHDIHPATALALPQLFAALKAGGYRIVHVVPASADRPKTPTEPQDWMMAGPHAPLPWPLAAAGLKHVSFGIGFGEVAAFGPDARVTVPLITAPEWAPRGVDPAAKLEARAIPNWPSAPRAVLAARTPLPEPEPGNFGVRPVLAEIVATQRVAERPARRRHVAGSRHERTALARQTSMR